MAQAVFTVWAVMTLSFVLIRSMPGNAVTAYVMQLAEQTQDLQAAYEQAQFYFSLDPRDPLHVAYADYMTDFLQGELGRSISEGRPVAEILGEAIPWTLFLMSWTIGIGFPIGITLGALMAYFEGSKFDTGLTAYAVTITSIPFYVFALLALIFFAYRLGWFPTGGRQPTGVDAGFNLEYIFAILHHAALPVLSMIIGTGFASLGMRGNSIRVLGENYVRVGRLRGLSDTRLAINYVGRNAILPMYTGLMIGVGKMFGGAIVAEEIFGYQGMGRYMLQAVTRRDYSLMMGAFTVITIAVVICLFVADLTYGKLDPRAGTEDQEAY